MDLSLKIALTSLIVFAACWLSIPFADHMNVTDLTKAIIITLFMSSFVCLIGSLLFYIWS